jgi:hypothetical protein
MAAAKDHVDLFALVPVITGVRQAVQRLRQKRCGS